MKTRRKRDPHHKFLGQRGRSTAQALAGTMMFRFTQKPLLHILRTHLYTTVQFHHLMEEIVSVILNKLMTERMFKRSPS
jgi:hypothetical protein